MLSRTSKAPRKEIKGVRRLEALEALARARAGGVQRRASRRAARASRELAVHTTSWITSTRCRVRSAADHRRRKPLVAKRAIYQWLRLSTA